MTVNAAIVGLGRWGRTFVDSVQGKSARLRFVHAVEPQLASARELAQRQGLRLSADLSAALADVQVSAVVLATPHSLHREQVLACARAGKHVFCEKPLALRLSDAKEMVEACQQADVVLGLGHNRRFWPSIRETARMMRAGELGHVLHVEGHNSNENSNRVAPGSWRDLPQESPGGGLTGSGLHVLDTFVSLLGPARRVHAQVLYTKPAPAPLDTMSAMYEFVCGASGLLGTIRATPFYWRLHIFGTAGSAESLGETELVVRRGGKEPERVYLEPIDSVRAEIEAFAAAVEGGPAYPIPAHEVLWTVAAFEATVRSLASRAAEQIDAA